MFKHFFQNLAEQYVLIRIVEKEMNDKILTEFNNFSLYSKMASNFS